MRTLLAVLVLAACCGFAGDEQFNGRWDIKTFGEPRGRAWWLEIEGAGTPNAKGRFVSAYAGDMNIIDEISIRDGVLKFGFFPKERPKPGAPATTRHLVYTARLVDGKLEGTFEMDGGFIQGGPIWGSGEDAATLTFTLPSRMRVSAVMSAAAGAGGDRSAFGFSLRVLDSSGRQVGNPASGASTAQLTQDFNAGTYTAEIRTRDGSPAGSYQLTLTAPILAGATGAGYLAPNSVAFGAFYIPEAQTVRMRLIGHRDSGPWGAGDMVLTLKDASRRVLRVVDRTGAHLP